MTPQNPSGPRRQGKTLDQKSAMQRQISATHRQIDQLVYELCGLTGDEIRILEEATQ